MNLPVIRPRHYETSALGAAILSSVAMGVYQDIHKGVESMTAKGEVFRPEAHSVRIYQSVYSRVFKRLFGRLRKIYRELDAILKEEE